MSFYYGFRPYVPVAQRRRQALQEIEKKRKKGLNVRPIVINGRIIAKTFWGKAWCDNLESYSDFENRLPRGRTYVRNGSVVHLEIQQGKISAMVSGSELYSVEIAVASLSEPHWKRIKTQCAGKIGSLVELLQARLSTSVMDIVTQRGEGLFPKPAEITMTCSCPDWAGMCKHVAAVMYGVGARLDDQPELLFVLRKVDHLELIAGAVDGAPAVEAATSRRKKTIASADLADVFGIELAQAEPAPDAEVPAANKRSRSRVRASATVSERAMTRGATATNKSGRSIKGRKKRAKAVAARRKAARAGTTKSPSSRRAKLAAT
jgi:uncharacterized Zn finger protein